MSTEGFGLRTGDEGFFFSFLGESPVSGAFLSFLGESSARLDFRPSGVAVNLGRPLTVPGEPSDIGRVGPFLVGLFGTTFFFLGDMGGLRGDCGLEPACGLGFTFFWLGEVGTSSSLASVKMG